MPSSASTVAPKMQLACSALARKGKWFIASSKAFKKSIKSTLETLWSVFNIVSDLTAQVKRHVACTRKHPCQKTSLIKTSTKCCFKKIKCFFPSCRREEWVYPVGQQQLYTVGCSSSCSWHKVSFRVTANVSACVSSQQLKAVMEKWTWSAWGL